MIKSLALTLVLAISATAAVAAIPGRGGDISEPSLQVSNTAAKADRLDASAKSDRLPLADAGKVEPSLIITGPVRLASAR